MNEENKEKKKKNARDRKISESSDAPTKTKAELKAERRAKQEAQRAAKAALKSNPQKQQQQQQKGQTKKQPSAANKQNKHQDVQQTKSTEATQKTQPARVSDNIQLDDKKVVKRIAKTLAKQQVPQRSGVQKKVKLFSHLYQYEKDISLTKDMKFCSGIIHPAIIKLGLQYAEGIITGCNARSIALLCAFKHVISDYTTPASKELSRDLESKLKPCISFLSQCRHLSVSMGNAIKFLKAQITSCTPEEAESEVSIQAELLV